LYPNSKKLFLKIHFNVVLPPMPRYSMVTSLQVGWI
jgi:hypothetical protein